MRGTYIDSKGNLVRPTQEAINKNTMTYIDKSGNLSSREIMPPVSNKKKKDKWINLEAFDDGFDLVDIPKTILGTAGDVGLRLVKGVSDIGADIGKLGAGGLAQIADWTGHDEYADRLRDALAGKNEKTNEWLKKYTPSGVLEQAGEKIDKYSLAGEKLDKVNESVGQIGAYAASGGVSPLLGTATMFGSSAGGNLSEAYSKEGVTNSQAWIKALAAGGISVVTEKALGFFSNGKGIDTKIANKISSKLTDGASKTFARYGIQATAESVEEFLEYAGNQLLDLGIDATSDNKGAKFHKDWDWEEVGEQMGGAFLASMIVGGGQTALGVRGIKNENNLNTKEAINEYAKQMDVAEGVLTDNEQKVLNKELENRIEEQSKDGKTLSKKEISKLEEQIKNDMSKGRISVETIEEALGGNNTTQNDILLQNSYNEKANRSVAYNADLSQYNEKQRAIVQKAIDSGVLNNTNRSHEMVDLVAKLAEDKGMDFDFVNNEKLKDTGFALEGKQVNGYNNGTSIGINIDSNKALNSVIGHEITHVLEGTDLYNELQNSIMEYAKTKGEYDTRLKELQELYKDVKDANIQNELTSDLVGDYLFTDEDFVNRLYNNNRNVFQKIYDEIKYFIKQVAPGSKEAKQLEQVKRAFEKAYNQKSTNVDNNTKYELSKNALQDVASIVTETQEQAKNNPNQFAKLKDNTIKSLVDYGIEDLPMLAKRGHVRENVLTPEQAEKLGYSIKNKHFHGLGVKTYLEIIDSMDNPVGVYQYTNKGKYNENNFIVLTPIEIDGKKAIVPIEINNNPGQYNNIQVDYNKVKTAYFKNNTNYIQNLLNEGKIKEIFTGSNSQQTSLSTDNIPQNDTKVNDISTNSNMQKSEKNTKFSISEDNQGRELSKQQQEYFKDSKVRDDEGRLLEVYHGTNANFNTYDNIKTEPGYWFTENKEYASEHGKNIKSQYLNLTNPITDIDSMWSLAEEKFGKNVTEKQILSNDFKQFLIEKGYDGMVWDHSGSNTYIAFYPNQIKNIDNTNPTSNEDIRYSLSEQNKKIAPVGNYQIKGKDVKLEKIAPVKETKEKVNMPIREDITAKEIPKNPTKEESYEPVKRTRKDVQNELKTEMGITLDDLQLGKDINSIGYQRTDPIRLNEKVFGAEVGQKINDATINRTKHNEAERTRFLNKERQEIKDLGIKARSAESAAVQKYGEKQYVDDKGVIHKYGDAELAAEFPNVETQDKIKEAAKVLREKYDTYLDDINSVITEMGYDPIPKRADYMRHFQEINDKLSEWGVPLNATDMSKDTLPTDINGVTDQFKPGKNWFASAMQRKGFKTTYDAITGIDGYLEGASNLMYHTGDIQRYRTLSKMIREAYGQQHGMDNLDVSTKEGQQRLNDIMDNKLSKYAAWLDEQANALAGKKGGIDRAAERLLGRKIYTVLDTAKKQVGSNMTGFNVRSALTNFASAVQGASKTKKTAFIKGTISTLKNMVHNDGLINKSDFLTNRFGSDQLSKKLWQKASNAGQIFMTGSDYFTANQIWRSKYFENLSKGMNETQAIKNADDFASRIMGDRSKGSTAEIFNSKTLGLLTQFQLEVNNQWSSIVHDNKMDLQKGNKSGATVVFQLGELAAASYFFNNLMKSLTGSDVMIDPIDMLMKMLGADDDDKDKSVGDRATEVIGDLIDDLPFASIMTGGRIPMSEAFKGGGTAFKKLSGQKDQYGNDISWKDVGGDLIESGAYWLLPTGYGQLKKTKNGLSMYDEDLPMPGSYTKSGNLRFRADESAEGKIKAALFGQYSSEEARKYMESGYKTVDKRKLGELQELDFPTSKYLEYKQELSDAGKSNIAKLDYLESTDKYTDREKNIMYKSILNLKDDEINRMNELMDVEEQNEYMYVKTQANAIKRDESLTAPEKKEQIVDLILDTDFDDEALAYLYSKFYTKEEKLQNILNADIPMKEFIKFDSQDFDGEFDESKGRTKTNSRKYETLQYIQSLKLSAVQKALLAKSKYSSYKAYDKQIAQYIQSRNLSLLDKYKLVKYAGFKSYDKQIANYIAGLNMSSAEKQQLYKDMGFTTHNGRVYYK